MVYVNARWSAGYLDVGDLDIDLVMLGMCHPHSAYLVIQSLGAERCQTVSGGKTKGFQCPGKQLAFLRLMDAVF